MNTGSTAIREQLGLVLLVRLLEMAERAVLFTELRVEPRQ